MDSISPIHTLYYKQALFQTLSKLLYINQTLRNSPVTLDILAESGNFLNDLSQTLNIEKNVITPYRFCLCQPLVQLYTEALSLCSERLIEYYEKLFSMSDPGPQIVKAFSTLSPYFPLIAPSPLNFFQFLMLSLLEKHPETATTIMATKDFFQAFRQARSLGGMLHYPQQWACIGRDILIDLSKSITAQLYGECVFTLGRKFRDFTGYSSACPEPSFAKEGTSFENAMWIGGMKAQCYTLTRIFDKIGTLKSFKFAECCQYLMAIRMKLQNPRITQRKTQLLEGYLTLLRYVALQMQRMFINILSLPESRERRGSVQLIFCYIEEILGIILGNNTQRIGELYENREFNLQITELKGYYERMMCNITVKLAQLRSAVLKQILKEYSGVIQVCAKKMMELKEEQIVIDEVYRIIQEGTYFPKEVLGLRKGREYLILCIFIKFVKKIIKEVVARNETMDTLKVTHVARIVNGIVSKVVTEEAGIVPEEKLLKLLELKRIQSMIILWSGIEDYNYESVNLSINDYKLVTKLKSSIDPKEASNSKRELNRMLMHKYNPV